MYMRVSSTLTWPVVFLAIALSAFTQIAAAQSGRSWMNGFVFADSDTNGLAGATVELIGDQNNDRLKSVRLSTKAESDGKYSLKDIPYGDYTFRVSAEGYEPYEIKLYIGSDMLTEIHVRLRRKKS
jgi:Carboxypeptidase regulatory-like domain